MTAVTVANECVACPREPGQPTHAPHPADTSYGVERIEMVCGPFDSDGLRIMADATSGELADVLRRLADLRDEMRDAANAARLRGASLP